MSSSSSSSCACLPAASDLTRPPWLGLSVLLLAGFVTIFDLFVVNVAIPSMQADLAASFTQMGLVVAAYELAFGALLITGGRLGDVFGRRRLFVVGMAAFTLASMACGLAPSVEWLITARVWQGLTAALLLPQVYASIRVHFEGQHARRAFGLLGMSLGLAAIAGQVLGGWLIHADWFGLGWRNLFFINWPIGMLAIAAARFIPESRAPQRPGLDGLGVLLASASLGLLLVALMEGPAQAWPAWSWWAMGLAVLLLALFYRQQERLRLRSGWPLVDMRLLTQKRFALGAVLVLLVYSTSSSFFLCFALLVQTGLGLDPFMAGSIFAPCSVGFVLASLAAPRWMARWGMRAIILGAAVYAAAIAALMAQVQWAGGSLQAVQLIPVLVVLGAAQGLIMTPLLNLVLGFVDAAQAGMASGVISTLQQVGAALGVAVVGMWFGAVLSETQAASQAQQYVWAFVAGMRYNLIAAFLTVWLLWLLSKQQRDGL